MATEMMAKMSPEQQANMMSMAGKVSGSAAAECRAPNGCAGPRRSLRRGPALQLLLLLLPVLLLTHAAVGTRWTRRCCGGSRRPWRTWTPT